jgi:hypothetical protein
VHDGRALPRIGRWRHRRAASSQRERMNLRQIFPLAIVFGGLGLWIDPAPVLAQGQTPNRRRRRPVAAGNAPRRTAARRHGPEPPPTVVAIVNGEDHRADVIERQRLPAEYQSQIVRSSALIGRQIDLLISEAMPSKAGRGPVVKAQSRRSQNIVRQAVLNPAREDERSAIKAL